VSQHDNEEANVEVRQEGTETSDQTPREGHDQIGSVVRLAHNTPPTISQQQVTVCSLDVVRVLDMAIGQLRESIAGNEGTVLLHTESVLLRVTGVENVVGTQQGNEQTNSVREGVGDGNTGSLFELHQVDRGIAVGEWNTRHIPEYQHETWKKNKYVNGDLAANGCLGLTGNFTFFSSSSSVSALRVLPKPQH
jgi:hypothetical protein